MEIKGSFAEWIAQDVQPLRRARPDWLRLDGSTGGNRKPFGLFRHRGKVWRVHSDTWFEPLERALEWIQGGGGDPFVEQSTSDGTACLELRPELSRGPHKHFYCYEVAT